MPALSMSVHANYKTQSNAYDQLLVGKQLTNRAIMRYARLGRYGPQHIPTPRRPRVSGPTINTAKRVNNLVESLLCD